MNFALVAALLTVVASAMLMIHSDTAAEAVRRGIAICGGSVIPSLFPMMFISQYTVKSGAAELTGSLLNKPVQVLFGLPGVCGVVLLTSFIGGYPAGAKAAETLVNDGMITPEEGRRLANMAFCAGPGFAIGMIGGELYKNKSIGLLILTAQALSCIIIGTVYRFLSGKDVSRCLKKAQDDSSVTSPKNDAFVQVAAGTASALLNMCSFIVLFQIIVSMIELSGINDALGMLSLKAGMGNIGKWLLPCIVEVTGGSILSVGAGLPFTAFVVGFGGLSVHFQNFALCRSIRLHKGEYIFTRAMQGLLCSLTVWLAMKLPYFSRIEMPASVKVGGSQPVSFSQISVGFGCAMLVMCLMSVICLPSERKSVKL